MFAYCGNNPVNCSDPSGHLWRIVLIAAIYVTEDYMDIIEANYVAYHRPSPMEATRNISNHIATKGAAIGVGGLMCVTAFGQLEVREFHGMY